MSPKRAVLAKCPRAVLRKRIIAPHLGPHYEFAVVVLGGDFLSENGYWSGSASGAWWRADRYLALNFDEGVSKA